MITSDVLQDIHWLRVPQRIEFKLCLTVHKVLHNLAPSYLAELCISFTAVATRQRLCSSSSGNRVVPKPRSEFGKRAFAFAGPHAWNNLSQTIKSWISVAVFKNWRRLFRKCYKLSCYWFFLLLFALFFCVTVKGPSDILEYVATLYNFFSTN